MPLRSLPEYRQRLTADSPPSAFACLVRQSGYAPGLLTAMPSSCLRAFPLLFLSVLCSPEIESLLPAILAEHEQIALLDYHSSTVTLPSQCRSCCLAAVPALPSAPPEIDTLHRVIPGLALEIVYGLGHDAPVRKPPLTVAQCLLRFLRLHPATTAPATRYSGLPVDQAQLSPPRYCLGAVARAQLA